MIEWRKHPEYESFMREFIPGHTEIEIREAFLDKFGIELSRSQIKNFKVSRGIKSGTMGGRFTPGRVPANKGKKLPKELYEQLVPTMFKKGNVPHNHRPVGSERIDKKDGYVSVKVAEPNKWKLKQRLMYEQYTGETLTRNEVIIFLDGNKNNFAEDNLMKLTRTELIRYCQDRLYCEDPEISKGAAMVAKLKVKGKQNDNIHDGY